MKNSHDSYHSFFRKRQIVLVSMLTGFACLIAISNHATGFSFSESVSSFPVAIGWMVKNLIPNLESWERFPNILEKLLTTVLISIMASVIASCCALLCALLGSQSTRPSYVFTGIVRGIASFFRNIPIAAWAMIFLFSFGQSDFTGFLAIGVESFGFLTRAFLEAIDETAGESVEALQSAGATRIQIIGQSVIPSVMPQVVSWMLYMIETNIRSATLVGILTGTGIGFLFNLYYKQMNYSSAGLVTISVVVVVLVIELISNALRRMML